MKKKKKKTAKLVDKSSLNYTFTGNDPANYLLSDEQKQSQGADSKLRKITVSDIKKQNKRKSSSKKIKTLQGHSPIYE